MLAGITYPLEFVPTLVFAPDVTLSLLQPPPHQRRVQRFPAAPAVLFKPRLFTLSSPGLPSVAGRIFFRLHRLTLVR